MRGESGRQHDVVITSAGLATSLGLDIETTWARVRRGECGIGPIPEIEQPLPPGSDGGQCPDLPEPFSPHLPREVRYLRWALLQAIGDGLPHQPERRALMLGTTLHGMRAGGDYFRTGEARRLATFLAGDTAALASEGLGLDGFSATTCSACSSSLGAVALGVTLLQQGDVDVVVAGGYDVISEYAWAGFNSLRLVADGPLRPFCRSRRGMKISEGYGVLVLERRDTAVQFGRRLLATVSGWGESADSFHLTRPDPAGTGALAAMKEAVHRAGIAPAALGLIAAHATGTPDNEVSEASAILQLMDGSGSPPVVGFKSHLGHTLGGAGAVELILSMCALRDGIVPPCANVRPDEIEFPGLDVSTGGERRAPIEHVLNSSLGFGGANTCVVLSGPHGSVQAVDMSIQPREVVITGIGILLPGAVGNYAFAHRVAVERRDIADSEFEHLISARRTRRMSLYVRLSLCAATLACQDADLTDPTLLQPMGAVLGTTHGSSTFCEAYYAQVVREGALAANPVLFAEGVPNAAAAQLSLMLGLRGGCQTLIGTLSAGVSAIKLAAARISTGAAERLIVVAAEELSARVDEAYQACNTLARPGSAAAVAIVMESAEAALERGGRPRARIGAGIGNPPGPTSREVQLAGTAFSVEPLIELADWMLRRDTPSELFGIQDRRAGRSAVRLERV